jgi:hypothetical protein
MLETFPDAICTDDTPFALVVRKRFTEQVTRADGVVHHVPDRGGLLERLRMECHSVGGGGARPCLVGEPQRLAYPTVGCGDEGEPRRQSTSQVNRSGDGAARVASASLRASPISPVNASNRGDR